MTYQLTTLGSKITALDLTSLRDRLLVSNSHATEADANALITEYKKWLFIKIKSDVLADPENQICRTSPPQVLDEVWQTHILDTRAYVRDCHSICGCIIHHNDEDIQLATHHVPLQSKEVRVANTKTLYALEFGTALPEEDAIWNFQPPGIIVAPIPLLRGVSHGTADLMRCCICLDAMHNPVTLPCSHNGCMTHLKQVFRNDKRRCPICRKGVSYEFIHDMRVNNTLKDLIAKSYPNLDMERAQEDAEDAKLHEKDEEEYRSYLRVGGQTMYDSDSDLEGEFDRRRRDMYDGNYDPYDPYEYRDAYEDRRERFAINHDLLPTLDYEPGRDTHRYNFQSNEFLAYAVDLWCTSRFEALARFGHISYWETSEITSMESLFRDRTDFNDDISGWDVKSVLNMGSMFRGASSFNQPIGRWDVGSVKNMPFMFCGASSFNQSLSWWNVINVQNMYSMFQAAASFDQSLRDWNMQSVRYMKWIFVSCPLSIQYHKRPLTSVMQSWAPY